MKYVAFDVESPNNNDNRMSAIGITVIENGTITDTFYSLVNPQAPFDWYIRKLTGITKKTVANAPTFPELWPTIEPYFSSGVLVAHGAEYDLLVLKRCLRDYQIKWKDKTEYLCTYKMAPKIVPGVVKIGIEGLSLYFGIETGQAHHAGDDSRGCAEILLKYMELADVNQYIKTYDMTGKEQKKRHRKPRSNH